MAEEFVEVFAELADDLSWAGRESSQAEFNAIFDSFKEKAGKFGYDEFADFSVERVFTDDGNGARFEMKGPKGEVIDIREVNIDMQTGKIGEAFEKMGFKEQLKNPDVQEFIKQQKIEYEATDRGQIEKGMKDAKVYENHFTKEPANYKEFEQEASKATNKPTSEIEAKNKEFQEAKKGGETSLRKWITDNMLKNPKFYLLVGLLLTVGLVAKDLYDYIEGVKHALSGCWLTTQNSRCKIDALTCNSKDLRYNDAKPFEICKTCDDVKSPSCAGLWYPMKTASCACDPAGVSKYPGIYQGDKLTGTNTCPGVTNPNCPINKAKNRAKRERYQDPCSSNRTDLYPSGSPLRAEGDDDPACPTTDGCIVKAEACSPENNQGHCSSWCSPAIAYTQGDQVIGCQVVSFAQAFGVGLGGFFGLPGDLLQGILKVLLYIAVGIVGLVIVVYLIKWALHFASSGGSEKH